MNKYIIYAIKSGESPNKRHKFIRYDKSFESAECNFLKKYPYMAILDIFIEEENISNSSSISPTKQRSHFKARLCQIRNNLQSMTDSESPYLTHEEVIQLQRISCKVDNVISKFGMRTMDLKNGGIL